MQCKSASNISGKRMPTTSDLNRIHPSRVLLRVTHVDNMFNFTKCNFETSLEITDCVANAIETKYTQNVWNLVSFKSKR